MASRRRSRVSVPTGDFFSRPPTVDSRTVLRHESYWHDSNVPVPDVVPESLSFFDPLADDSRPVLEPVRVVADMRLDEPRKRFPQGSLKVGSPKGGGPLRALSFVLGSRDGVCVARRERREVLFATGRGGKRGRRVDPVRRGINSKVRC